MAAPDFYNRMQTLDYPLVSGSTFPRAVLLDVGFVSQVPAAARLVSCAVAGSTVTLTFTLGGAPVVMIFDTSTAFGTKVESGDHYAIIGDASAAVAWSVGADVEAARIVPLFPGVQTVRVFSELDDDGSAVRYQYVQSCPDIQQAITMQAGHNVALQLSNEQLQIEYLAGAGAGTVCAPVELVEYAGAEVVAPVPTQLLTCGDYLAAVNCVLADASGTLQIAGVGGVSVVDYPDQHKIVVDLSAVTNNTKLCGANI